MRRLVLAVALLLGSLVPLPAAAQEAAGRVDLPALMPTPADLDEAGLGGYVAGVGTVGGGTTMASFAAAYRGGDAYPQPATTRLVRGAALVLVRADDLTLPSPARVVAWLGEYGDDDAAAEAAGDLLDARATRSDADPGAGEANTPSTVTVSGPDPLSGPSWRQASAVTTSGSVVIDIAIEVTGPDDPNPDAGIAAALAALVAGRIADDPAPVAGAPSFAVPDVTGDEVRPDIGRYVLIGDQPVAVAGDDEAATEARTRQFEAYAATGVYEYAWRTGDGAVSVGGYASGHETEDDARAYFAAVPDLLASDGSLTGVEVGNARVPVGDSATLVTYGLAAVPGVAVTELVLRQDTIVLEIVVAAPAEVTAADMTTLARAAVDCLRGDCDPVRLPASIVSAG